MGSNGADTEYVNLIIDGKNIRVPKGTNVIEAAKGAGIEIPYYCYHPHLSIAGNCRMCKIAIKGAPKMEIACNTIAREGMEIQTHFTNQAVADTQAATLEFILINHPLDCTVCDQAGHCKLQDYHYEYNARESRFLEEKEHKVKAEPLGPTVMLDGERCIMCTRCIRFCDEITQTSELGMLNRGDKSVIAISPGKELNNALSGTVVDLCPVGALTHKKWRFNTRIWFTNETDSICPGCSTGCNVKTAVRDGEVVQVKARLNSDVNKEWLCDEGRYGFGRFLPKERLLAPAVSAKESSGETALTQIKSLSGADTAIFVSPDLTLEEYVVIRLFIEKHVKGASVSIAYRERGLSQVEAILVSPDYAANFRGAEYSGLVGGNLTQGYEANLHKLRTNGFKNVLMLGDRSVIESDQDQSTLQALQKATLSVFIGTNKASGLAQNSRVCLPGRSILEKSGLLVNRKSRLQYTDKVIDYPNSSEPEWRILNRIAQQLGGKIVDAQSDRELTLWLLKNDARLAGLSIRDIKLGGIPLDSYKPGSKEKFGAEGVSAASV